MTDVEDKTVMIGSPAMPAAHARRVYMLMTKLPELVDRLRDVEQRLAKLEDAATLRSHEWQPRRHKGSKSTRNLSSFVSFVSPSCLRG